MIPLALRLAEIAPPGNHFSDVAPIVLDEPVSLPEPEPSGILAARVEQAFEEGRLAGEAAAHQENNEKLAEQQLRFEETLKSERASWTAEQAKQLSAQIDQAIGQMEIHLADQLARILEPFLETVLRQKAVAEFSDVVGSILREDQDPVFVVRAPQDMLDALDIELGDLSKKIDKVASATCEVEALSGMSIFETQISQWLASLRECAK